MTHIVTCTRRLEWDSGHRVLGHEGKCRHLHGHRYAAEITVEAANLNELGMVVDFSVVKGIVGAWIDQYWDHNMLLHPEDPLAKLYRMPTLYAIQEDIQNEMFKGKNPYIMPADFPNPTAENIARVLLIQCQRILPTTLLTSKVRVYETPNCYAEASTLVRLGVKDYE